MHYFRLEGEQLESSIEKCGDKKPVIIATKPLKKIGKAIGIEKAQFSPKVIS